MIFSFYSRTQRLCRATSIALVLSMASYAGAQTDSEQESLLEIGNLTHETIGADTDAAAKLPEITVTTNLEHSFGIALYQFNQGNYFQALVEISAANNRQVSLSKEPSTHQQAMQILEAGIMLSYGMQNNARDLIKNVADKTLGGPQQDIAWFYLAKLYADKQNWQQSYKAIDNIGDELPHKLRATYERLKANVYINNGQLNEALALIKRTNDPVLRAYTSFNLAVAEQKNKNFGAAHSHLGTITSLKSSQLEVRLLKDRAHLAAAQMSIVEQDFNAAFNHFSLIKIDSPYSGEALFGQGWAAYYTDKPTQALASWNQLLANYSLYPEAEKSRIAIPFVYLSMDNTHAALRQYNSAVSQYEALMSELDSIKTGVGNGRLFEFMAPFKTGKTIDWHKGSVNFPVTNETVLIGGYLENQNIHEDLTALAELYQLSYTVGTRRQDLASFGYLIETVDTHHEEKAPIISSEISSLQQSQTAEQARQLRATVSHIEKTNSTYSLMNADEIGYMKRIKRSNSTLAAITKASNKARYQQRVERINGILLWNLSEAFPARIWQAKKGLNEIEKSIASSKQIQKQLQNIIIQQASTSGPITQKVEDFKQRLEQTAQSIERLISQQELKIQHMYLLALDSKKEEVRQYLVHSHLAIARLTDAPITDTQTDESAVDEESPTEPETSTTATSRMHTAPELSAHATDSQLEPQVQEGSI